MIYTYYNTAVHIHRRDDLINCRIHQYCRRDQDIKLPLVPFGLRERHPRLLNNKEMIPRLQHYFRFR